MNAVRPAVDIMHGDLRFGVRAQPGQPAVAGHFALPLHQTVRIMDGRRHEIGGFVAGVAEHQALVACAQVQMIVARMIDRLGDLWTLLVVSNHDRATFVIDAVVAVVVADASDGVARNLDVIDRGAAADFAGEQHKAGVAQGFGGHARRRILLEQGIENRVRDLVRHFVGMSLGDRLRGEKEFSSHEGVPFGIDRRPIG